MPRSSSLETDDLARHAGGLLLPQHGRADEVVFLPADDPAQIRFERARRLIDVVAVEPHGRFEPERVPRAKAARNQVHRAPGFQDGQPEPIGGLRRREDLESVLARVAGARNSGADVGDLAVREPVVLQRCEVHAGQRLQDLERARPLDGEERIARARVNGHGVAGCLDVLRDVRVIRGDVRGVDDQQEVLRRQPVNEQVVDKRAFRRQQARVLRLPDRKPRRVVARDALDRLEGVLPGDLDFAHVADVEDAGAFAHRHVLRDDARVLHGHVPAAKGDHLGARGPVTSVERRFLERCFASLFHGRALWVAENR